MVRVAKEAIKTEEVAMVMETAAAMVAEAGTEAIKKVVMLTLLKLLTHPYIMTLMVLNLINPLLIGTHNVMSMMQMLLMLMLVL